MDFFFKFQILKKHLLKINHILNRGGAKGIAPRVMEPIFFCHKYLEKGEYTNFFCIKLTFFALARMTLDKKVLLHGRETLSFFSVFKATSPHIRYNIFREMKSTQAGSKISWTRYTTMNIVLGPLGPRKILVVLSRRRT